MTTDRRPRWKEFHLGELWEREVLDWAESPGFITIKVFPGYFPPSLQTIQQKVNLPPCNTRICKRDCWEGRRCITPNSYVTRVNGQHIKVGRQWLQAMLSDEALASYIAGEVFL